jgi:hypothetical protein
MSDDSVRAALVALLSPVDAAIPELVPLESAVEVAEDSPVPAFPALKPLLSAVEIKML